MAKVSTSTFFWFTAFCVSSVGMTIGNKFANSAIDFSGLGGTHKAMFKCMLFIWQNSFAVVMNFIMYGLYSRGLIKDDTWEMKAFTVEHWKRTAITSINFGLMLFASGQALPYSNVATVTIGRIVATVFIAIGDYFIFGKIFSTNLTAALFLAGLGSYIYVYNDFDWKASKQDDNQMLGYFWVTVNTGLFVIGQLWEKYAMTRSADQTALGIGTIKNILSLPVFLVISACQICYNTMYKKEKMTMPQLDQLSLDTWIVIVLTGIGCFAISIVYMTLYKISNATSITVGGNFNKVVSIIVASWVFPGQQIHSANAIVGLFMSICGSVWYSLEEIKNKNKSKERKS